MRYLQTEPTYILSNFEAGDTVTITIYRLSDDVKIVDAIACLEIATTGRFKYLFAPTVTTKTEFLWIATNGIEEQQGKIILGGYPDHIDDLHKLQGLDLTHPMTVTPESRSVGTISQTISGDGETSSTVTRTA